jgi:hypothetical protein
MHRHDFAARLADVFDFQFECLSKHQTLGPLNQLRGSENGMPESIRQSAAKRDSGFALARLRASADVPSGPWQASFRGEFCGEITYRPHHLTSRSFRGLFEFKTS